MDRQVTPSPPTWSWTTHLTDAAGSSAGETVAASRPALIHGAAKTQGPWSRGRAGSALDTVAESVAERSRCA